MPERQPAAAAVKAHPETVLGAEEQQVGIDGVLNDDQRPA
ncbi:MAG: hypothetical protein H6Q02_227, partial [Acidobacteria bacterium]|nr:hypothetical protein [Acidobacteriota bacterium]